MYGRKISGGRGRCGSPCRIRQCNARTNNGTKCLNCVSNEGDTKCHLHGCSSNKCQQRCYSQNCCYMRCVAVNSYGQRCGNCVGKDRYNGDDKSYYCHVHRDLDDCTDESDKHCYYNSIPNEKKSALGAGGKRKSKSGSMGVGVGFSMGASAGRGRGNSYGPVYGGQRYSSPIRRISGGYRSPDRRSPGRRISGGYRSPSPARRISGGYRSPGRRSPSPGHRISGGYRSPSPARRISGGYRSPGRRISGGYRRSPSPSRRYSSPGRQWF